MQSFPVEPRNRAAGGSAFPAGTNVAGREKCRHSPQVFPAPLGDRDPSRDRPDWALPGSRQRSPGLLAALAAIVLAWTGLALPQPVAPRQSASDRRGTRQPDSAPRVRGRLVEDLDTRLAPSTFQFPEDWASIDGLLYLDLDDGKSGEEPWRTDGTPEGTFLLEDVVPGPQDSFVQAWTEYEDQVAFVAGYSEYYAQNIHVTDGERGGTRPFLPLATKKWWVAQELFSYRGALCSGSHLFYVECFDESGNRIGESYLSDQDCWFGDLCGSFLRWTSTWSRNSLMQFENWYSTDYTHKSWSNLALFQGLDKEVLILHLGVPEPGLGRVTGASLGRWLFFPAWGYGGDELYRTDGTREETERVSDLLPGPDSSAPRDFQRLGGKVYFLAAGAGLGRELWRTDGREEGTRLVADVRPGPQGSRPKELTATANRLYFTAADGVFGREVYVSDGTTRGTHRLVDLRPGRGSSNPHGLAGSGRWLYWLAAERPGRTGLWRSGGQPGKAEKLWETVDPAVEVGEAVAPVKGGACFWTRGKGGLGAIWCYDGAARATRKVWASSRQTESAFGVALGYLGWRQRLMFFVKEWRWWQPARSIDGLWQWSPRCGLERLSSVVAKLESGYDEPPVQPWRGCEGDRCYFRGWTSDEGWCLWTTDGTPRGTRCLLPETPPRSTRLPGPESIAGGEAPSAASRPPSASPAAPHAMEAASTSGNAPPKRHHPPENREPSAPCPAPPSPSAGQPSGNATPERRHPAENRAASAPSAAPPTGGIALGNRFLFVHNDPEHGAEPWITDGTKRGTRLLKDIVPGPWSSSCRDFYRWKSRIFFSAWDPDHGREPWVTDGTTLGTRLLKDLTSLDGVTPSPYSSTPRSFQAVDGILYFLAFFSSEPWRTDGTAQGTFPVPTSHQVTRRRRQSRGKPDRNPMIGRRDRRASGDGAAQTPRGDTRKRWIYCHSGRATVQENGQWFQAILVSSCDYELEVIDPGSGRTTLLLEGQLKDGCFSQVEGFLRNSGRVIFLVGNRLIVSDGTPEGTRQFGTMPSALDYDCGEPQYTVDRSGPIYAASASGTWVARLVAIPPTGGHAIDLFAWWPEAELRVDHDPWVPDGSGGLFFLAWEPKTGEELWHSDGTPEGTGPYADLEPGPASAVPRDLYRLGDRLFLTANAKNAGRELWEVPILRPRPVPAASIVFAWLGGLVLLLALAVKQRFTRTKDRTKPDES